MNAYRKRWERHIAYRFGITPEDVAYLYEAQGGRCLCGLPLNEGARGTSREPWHIDHDANVGHVRGLLHQFCNRVGLAWVERVGIEKLTAYITGPGIVGRPRPPKRRHSPEHRARIASSVRRTWKARKPPVAA